MKIENIEGTINIGDMVGFYNPKLAQLAIVSDICTTTNPEIYILDGLKYSGYSSDLKKIPFKDGDYIHFRYGTDEWLILFKSYYVDRINTYIACVVNQNYVSINAFFKEFNSFQDVRYMTPSEIELLHKLLLKKGLVWSNDNKMVMAAPFKEEIEKMSFWQRISKKIKK